MIFILIITEVDFNLLFYFRFIAEGYISLFCRGIEYAIGYNTVITFSSGEFINIKELLQKILFIYSLLNGYKGC